MEPEAIFKAMADRTRQRALALLTKYELSVSELVEVLQQPQSTVSRHLKILRDARLVRDRRSGTTALYAANGLANGGDNNGLAGRLLAWADEQSISTAASRRLQAVMTRRREMSDRFFSEVGRHWDKIREESFGATFHLEALVALLPRDWTVADVGTGTGYLLPTLARRFKQVIAVDPVEQMLEAARHRVETEGLENVDLRSGDLSRLPIIEGTVDLAVAVLVLHHVPVPAAAAGELVRITRAGGRVLLVEQGEHGSEPFQDRMQDRWWGFSADEVAGLLEGVGLTDVETGSLGAPDPADDVPELFVVTGRKRIR